MRTVVDRGDNDMFLRPGIWMIRGGSDDGQTVLVSIFEAETLAAFFQMRQSRQLPPLLSPPSLFNSKVCRNVSILVPGTKDLVMIEKAQMAV